MIKKNKKIYVISLITVVVIVAVSAYFVLFNNKGDKENSENTANTVSSGSSVNVDNKNNDEKEETKTINLKKVTSSNLSYEEVILLNGFEEEDKKEIERLKIPESKMPSGIYFEELGVKGNLEVASDAKVHICDVSQVYTKNEDRKYVFNSWSEFVDAAKKDNDLLDNRYYVIKIKGGKVIELSEKLYF